MRRQEFKFVFPTSGETITKKLSPLAIKETCESYLIKQSMVRGNFCAIFNTHEEVIAMAYINERNKVSFFTEDESTNGIVDLTKESPEL